MEKSFGMICILLSIVVVFGCTFPQTREEDSIRPYEESIITRSGNETDEETGLFQGDPAPDFALESAEGDIINIREFKGKILFLNFWETTNPWSDFEVSYFNELYLNHLEDIEVVGISIGEEKRDLQDFAEREDISYPILWDIQGNVARIYQIQSLPTTYVIDGRGIIQNIHLGPMEKNQMESYLKEVMEE